MQIKKKMQKIIGFTLLGVAIIAVFIMYRNRGELIRNHNTTTGTIIKCEWASKATARYVVSAVFKVGETEYFSSCQLTCQDLRLEELNKKMVGLKVPVVYSPNDPSSNFLLVEKHSYDLYNVPFSDSLKWLDAFVNCK